MSYVVVVGSLNMDLVVRTESLPRAGETVTGTAFHTIPGGKGANQAVAIARLGRQVAMVGRVGADGFGAALRQGLKRQGVDVSHVTDDVEVPTGTATIIVDAAGESRIIVVPGANGRVCAEDLAAARELIAKASLLVLQLEVPVPTVGLALDMARECGVQTILNAAPALPVPPGFLERADYLVVNESEAGLLSGCPVDDRASAGRAAAALQGMGAHNVVITLGRQGALAAVCGSAGEALSLYVPARRVNVVDATAAGDAFIGGLAASLLGGQALPEALCTAVSAGTLAVTRLGAQTSLPACEEVEAFQRNQILPGP